MDLNERAGLINRSVFDESMMTTDDEPSIIEEYKHQGPPPNAKYVPSSSNTGKWKPSDLDGNKKMTFDNDL